MKLDLIDNFLQNKLNPLEIILAHRGSLSIPLDHVIHASAEKPKWDFVAIRAPGTHIPFLLKAGTYHSKLGKEFWLATISKSHLVVELKDWDYKRIVLVIGKTNYLAERINQAVGSIK